jgi:hypothetical protein
MKRLLLLILGLVACLALASSAQAGRVVQFEILVDGKVVLTLHKLDQGEAADTVWGYLKTDPVKNPSDVYLVSAEEAERLKAFQDWLNKTGENKVALKGKYRIFCRYGGDVTVDELRLVRASAKALWFLDPAQVDELAKRRTVDGAQRVRAQVDAAQPE